MSHPEFSGRTRSGFSLAYGLWIAAATMVVSGFILRLLAGLLGLPQLRLGGVAVLAAGLAVAALGWVAERVTERRRIHPVRR